MVLAFCLEHELRDDGKYQMTLAGSVNLDGIDSPQAMLIAASILRVPGFEGELEQFGAAYGHH